MANRRRIASSATKAALVALAPASVLVLFDLALEPLCTRAPLWAYIIVLTLGFASGLLSPGRLRWTRLGGMHRQHPVTNLRGAVDVWARRELIAAPSPRHTNSTRRQDVPFVVHLHDHFRAVCNARIPGALAVRPIGSADANSAIGIRLSVANVAMVGSRISTMRSPVRASVRSPSHHDVALLGRRILVTANCHAQLERRWT